MAPSANSFNLIRPPSVSHSSLDRIAAPLIIAALDLVDFVTGSPLRLSSPVLIISPSAGLHIAAILRLRSSDFVEPRQPRTKPEVAKLGSFHNPDLNADGPTKFQKLEPFV